MLTHARGRHTRDTHAQQHTTQTHTHTHTHTLLLSPVVSHALQSAARTAHSLALWNLASIAD